MPSIRWLPSAWVAGLRARLFAINADEVIAVLDALEVAGCEPCLAGGWGVDALLGRQTRHHADLDVIIAEDTLPAARCALVAAGYDELEEGVAAGPYMPVRVVARDPAGHTVDLLPLHLERLGSQAASAPAPFASPQPATIGHIRDRPVRCLSAGLQWKFHQGYPVGSHDRHDLPQLRAQLDPS